jgi:hypothetical protein
VADGKETLGAEPATEQDPFVKELQRLCANCGEGAGRGARRDPDVGVVGPDVWVVGTRTWAVPGRMQPVGQSAGGTGRSRMTIRPSERPNRHSWIVSISSPLALFHVHASRAAITIGTGSGGIAIII